MSKSALKDIAERVVRTFVAAFLALYLPTILGASTLGGLWNAGVADQAAAAGVAAVVTLVIGLLGVQVNGSDDASMLKK